MKRSLLSFSYFIFFCSLAFSQHIKINEILYDAVGSDNGYEWIEVYNNSTEIIDLKKWKLEKAGSEFVEVFVFPQINIKPKQYLVIGESNVAEADVIGILNFQNGGSATDGVRIISANGDTIDTILYDSPNTDNLPGDKYQPGEYFAMDVNSGYSLIRFPDGEDSDNCENDFIACEKPTPGKPNYIAQDIQLISLLTFPRKPDTTDCIIVVFDVKNNSTLQIQTDSIVYYIYLNQELYFTDCINETLLPEETICESINIGELPNNVYNLKNEIEYHQDENLDNNFLETSFLVGKSPVIINEILFKPEYDNIEWVEIYNRSNNDINLYKWNIKDSGTNWHLIETCKMLPSESYGIICEDTITFYDYYMQDCLFFETSGWSSLNNTTEDIVCFADSFFTLIDSAGYTPADFSCPGNTSIERINPFVAEVNNWDVSKDSMGATPGRFNSVTPKDYDVCADSIKKSVSDEFIKIDGFCRNIGFKTSENVKAVFFLDENFNSEYEECEKLWENEFNIGIGAAKEFTYYYENIEYDYYKFGFIIVFDSDQDINNNLLMLTCNYPHSYPICFNEIMSAPDFEESEWLEVYNNFGCDLEISNWKIADLKDTFSLNPIKDIIPAEQFLIIVKNFSDTLFLYDKYCLWDSPFEIYFAEGLPTLNNNEDILRIWDSYGELIDSVFYKDNWTEIDYCSLERINPAINTNNSFNWESSIDAKGGTPGNINSVFVETIVPETSLEVIPNPVSLIEKNSVLIEYNLPDVLTKVNIRIFDIKGRIIRWLSDQSWISSRGTIIWDCKKENGKTAEVGFYIIHLEGKGKHTNNIFRETTTMVIGEK